jgi:EamA domain-containing membrane protein RarD
MRKLFIVIAFIFAIIGIIFAILPLGTLGILPTGLALIFSILAIIKSDEAEKKLPKAILIIVFLTLFTIIAKSFVPDEVVQDQQFEQKKEASKKEDLKELEELEQDLE